MRRRHLVIIQKASKLSIVVLHIGPHKTATTLIQKNLFESKPDLLTQGVNYPDDFSRLYGHHRLSDDLRGGRFQKIRTTLERIGNSWHTNVFSCENLSALDVHQLRHFRSLLGDHEIIVVAGFRRPSERLFSLWQESIKHGGCSSYTDYAYVHFLRPDESRELNQYSTLEKFSDVFGEETIRLVDYDVGKTDGSILRRFQEASGIPMAEVKDEVLNKSYSIIETEILRALNNVARHKGELHKHNVRVWFSQYRHRFDRTSYSEIQSSVQFNSSEMDISDVAFDTAQRKQISLRWPGLEENIEYSHLMRKIPSDSWLLKPGIPQLLGNLYHCLRHHGGSG